MQQSHQAESRCVSPPPSYSESQAEYRREHQVSQRDLQETAEVIRLMKQVAANYKEMFDIVAEKNKQLENENRELREQLEAQRLPKKEHLRNQDR